MKRLLLITLFFGVCLTFNRAYAQRCLPGMRGIRLTGGLSDNTRWKNGDGFGHRAGMAVSTYTKNAYHWVAGTEYLEKQYGYRDCLYPASQLADEDGCYLNFLSDRKRTFLTALGLSAPARYETVNWDEGLLSDGPRLTDEDSFIYGDVLTLELSAYVTDKIVLLANGRQRVLFDDDCGKSRTQVDVGTRFMIR